MGPVSHKLEAEGPEEVAVEPESLWCQWGGWLEVR